MLAGVVAAEDLPQLNEDPWTGWFAGYERRAFRFGVNREGVASVMAFKEEDEPMHRRFWIEIEPLIEELKPDGKVSTRKAKPGGWQALTERTAVGGAIGYRGTVAGGAVFEVRFETDGDEIRGGGRIVERGKLTRNPVRFVIRIKVPNMYHYQKDEEKLEKIAKRDRISMVGEDGGKLRYDAWDVVDPGSVGIDGRGIRKARVDLAGFKGPRMDLDSGAEGLFEFRNSGERELYRGFAFAWMPDPEKDADGKGRFVLKFK